jgi:RND family efflux transporter MFP subunit
MPKRRRLLWGLAVVAVLVVAGGAWLSAANKERQAKEAWPTDRANAARDSAVVVTAEPVTIRPVQRTVEAVGTLHGYEEVTLSTKVDGRVRKINHEVSDRVAPGELLLEIDPTDYELTVRQAEKALSVELARLGLDEPPGPKADVSQIPSVVQAQVRMEKARGTLERMQAARSGVSVEDMAEKKAEVRVTQAEHENQVLLAKTGLATIRLKQEALAIARQQLRDTEVRVPIPGSDTPSCADGVKYAITLRPVAIGTSVKSGGEVFKLAIIHTLKLRAPVPERYGAEVKAGQKALVTTASHSEPFEGVVGRINPAVDPLTRTFEVEILISNPKDELKPGGFAKTAILTRLDKDATTVPLESPVTFAGITKIFLVEDGRAREVQVTLGVQQTAWVEVMKPALPRGALVVTSGQSAIADQTPITLRTLTPNP